MELEEFLIRGGEASAEHWLVWYRAPGLWMTAFWGRPRPAEIEQLVEIFDFALDERMDPSYRSLFDCTALESIEDAAFSVVIDYLVGKREQFQRRLARQALVRPEGLAGAVVAGAPNVLGYPLPFEVFTRVEPALQWLLGEHAGDVARELAARVQRAQGEPLL